jgi:uncharacterized small protein (DUF1192 family)
METGRPDDAAAEESAGADAAQRAEDTVDELEQRSEDLGEEIDKTSREWEAKRADRSVPGAPPPDADE